MPTFDKIFKISDLLSRPELLNNISIKDTNHVYRVLKNLTNLQNSTISLSEIEEVSSVEIDKIERESLLEKDTFKFSEREKEGFAERFNVPKDKLTTEFMLNKLSEYVNSRPEFARFDALDSEKMRKLKNQYSDSIIAKYKRT